jgi:hypothetical protein
VGIFYFIVAYGLAVWGSYICWHAEKEERMAQKAVERYLQKAQQENIMIIDANDNQEPLLNGNNNESDDEERRIKKKKRSKKPKILAIEN